MHLNEDIYSELEDNNHVGMQSVPHCVSYKHIRYIKRFKYLKKTDV